MKKILASLFAVLLAVLLLPGTADAAEVVFDGTIGENVYWALDTEGTLTITGEGAMKNNWYNEEMPFTTIKDRIKTVVIEEGITDIADYLFQNCTKLTSVTLPDSLTEIGASVFSGCESLPEINIPGNVVSIGSYAFSGCTSLTGIVLPEGITRILWSTFNNCTSLASIVIPSSVTRIESYDAFNNCISLTSIVLPDGLTYIGGEAFTNCSGLTELVIPDTVSYIGNSAFAGCSSLTSIVIPDGVTSIEGSTFSGCTSLTSITIPKSVTSIGGRVFDQCDSLTGITFPTSVSSVGYWLYWENRDSQLAALRFTWNAPEFDDEAFYAWFDKPLTIYYPQGNPTWEDIVANNEQFGDHGWQITWVGEEYACYHDDVVYKNTKNSTCTELGYTGDTHCASCDELLVKGVPMPMKEHRLVELPRVEPTCTETGLTQGEQCTICGTFTEPQEVIEAKGHSWDSGHTTKYPTETEDGEVTHSCWRCGESWVEVQHKFNSVVTPPTCHEGGFTTHTCANCGHVEITDETEPKPHDYAYGACTGCGTADPAWDGITRLAGTHRFNTAFLAADQMKQTLGIEKFDAVVVASGMDFADALSGSYLAAVYNAPILLACDVEKYNNEVKAYIQENLNQGGTVFILGGENAVPDSFKTGLEGFTVERLAGKHRFDTNLKVLERTGVEGETILVSTGLDFADCLSASAAGLPILLVYGETLTAEQAAFLETNTGKNLCILGGEGAVSVNLEVQLAGYGTVERLAGKSRFETSVLIAEKFFENPESAVLAYAKNFPDGLCGGSLAAPMGAPLILTMEKYETQAAVYIQKNAIQTGIILGGENLIPNTSIAAIFNLQ